MKTDSPNPDHEALKALLAQSFHSEEADDVPPLPDDLRDRIRDQYGKTISLPTGAGAAQPARETIFDKIRTFFMTPAYAGAAAALVLLAVVAVVLNTGGKDENVIRGGGPNAKPIVTVYLVNLDPAEVKELTDSLLLNKDSLVVVSLEEATKAGEPKVIVNGETDTIESFPSKGTAPEARALPAKVEQLDDLLADAVAEVRSLENEGE